MTGGFNNPIIGGGGALVYPSIHSPNFSIGPPIVGWAIDKNGNAFFGSVTVTGSLILTGTTGEFVYDGSGNLRSANVGQTVTDPLQGHTCYAGFSTFNGHGAVISLFSSTLDAQLWYADTATSAQGALRASVSSVAVSGTDPFGLEFLSGLVSYGSSAGKAVAVQILNGALDFWQAATQAGPYTQDFALTYTPVATPTLALTGPVLEIPDGLAVGQGAAVQTLVNGSTINTASITMQPVTAAASVTGIILQPGTFDGQVMAIPSNAAAGVTITFAARATSNVSVGTAGIIQPGSTMELFWVVPVGLWFPVQ